MQNKIVEKLKKASYGISIVVVGVVLGLSLQFAKAWTEPTAAPPGGNVGAPIVTGSATGAGQTKLDSLTVGANNTKILRSRGILTSDGIIQTPSNGYFGVGVGIGTTTLGTSKLKVTGVIETTSGGIKFPDGTIQTTAYCVPDGSCNAPAPACGTTTTGTDNCGTYCTKTGAACPACVVVSCNAPAPACGTTTSGTDNCGTYCTKTGSVCPPTPVPGVCGSASGAKSYFYSAPTTNVCSVGAFSGMSGSGPWTWTCAGTGGGANASCSAQKGTVSLSFSPNIIAGALNTCYGAIVAAQSTTINWAAGIAGASCTASGGWTGGTSASGSMTVTPVTSTNPFTFTCVYGGTTGTKTIYADVRQWQAVPTANGSLNQTFDSFLTTKFKPSAAGVNGSKPVLVTSGGACGSFNVGYGQYYDTTGDAACGFGVCRYLTSGVSSFSDPALYPLSYQTGSTYVLTAR